MAPTVQLLLYRFSPDASFEGQLVGALERLESGGTLRILDLLFVAKDGASGELSIVGMRGGAGGIVAPLLDFRLDPGARRRATQRALSNGTTSLPADVLRELGEALPPGGALAAVLVEHVWARALQDAVSRTGGGTSFGGAFVDSTTLADLAPELLAAAQAPSESEVDG